MGALLEPLLDLVLPQACAGCGRTGGALCAACRAVLAGPPLGPVRPDPCPAGLPAVVAAARYDGAVQRLLLAHKEHGRLRLTGPLGDALAAAAALLVGPRDPVLLCPVPSGAAAVRARGHDHALRLARAAAQALRASGVPARAVPLLRPARVVADQAGLSAAQRAANLRGALRAAGRPGPEVLLVDDVLTTGATLTEAARALRAAGHPFRGAAVVAATRRRRASGATS